MTLNVQQLQTIEGNSSDYWISSESTILLLVGPAVDVDKYIHAITLIFDMFYIVYNMINMRIEYLTLSYNLGQQLYFDLFDKV